MVKLTPEQILIEYKKGEIDRASSLNYLKSIIENCENGRIRQIALNIFAQIGGNSKDIFEFLENLLVSDNYPIIRGTAASIIINNFINRGEEVLEHALKHEKSIKNIIKILESLEAKNSESSRVLIKYIVPEAKTKSGILLPESKKQPEKTKGIIVEIGTDAVKLNLKKGDKVFIPKIYGEEIELNGEKHIIINAGEILGIIEE